MLTPKNRIFAEGQFVYPDYEATNDIIDLDTRRWYKVSGPPALEDQDLARDAALKVLDLLDPAVVTFVVSDNGKLIATGLDPRDDPTPAIIYPRCPVELSPNDTLTRTQLVEVDRLGREVDLVSYESDEKMVLGVFKYAIRPSNVQRVWKELHILKALAAHPSVIPVDRIILDEVESRVVGFTTRFEPGGNLNVNKTIPFRFRWLEQLTSFVDYLNLGCGIMHADLHARNLLVNAAGDLKVFDFNIASKINPVDLDYVAFKKGSMHDVHGVIFTLYELLTFDEQYRDFLTRHEDVSLVESLAHWPIKRPIEPGTDVAACRRFLERWVEDRRTKRTIQNHSDATEPLDWPPLPIPEPEDRGPFQDEDSRWWQKPSYQTRYFALQEGKYVVPWERPPQSVVDARRAERHQEVVAESACSEPKE